jgi:sialic acid synthase SpsE
MQIEHRLIDQFHLPFVVAEISSNHKQDINLARNLIEEAKYSGCDAVKFQTYLPEHITLDPILLKAYEKAHLPLEWHKELYEHAKFTDIMAFSSVFSPDAVDFLEQEVNPPCYKVASFELNHFPLLERLKETRKPLILSCGMASYADFNWIQLNFSALNTLLMKCVSQYPAEEKDFNLLTIPTIKREFGFEVGLSDHTRGLGVSIASVALGATMIERHFTLRRDGNPDDAYSLVPEEMATLCHEVKSAWNALGSVDWTVHGDRYYKRSIYAKKDIKKGEAFTKDNIDILRPNNGINPKELNRFLKSQASENIERGTALHYRHLK